MNNKMLIATEIIAAATVSAFGIPKMAHASGFSDGYRLAREDAQTGENNNRCGFQYTEAYFADFKFGYAAGTAGSLLHN
jgi:hypothetical protein